MWDAELYNYLSIIENGVYNTWYKSGKKKSQFIVHNTDENRDWSNRSYESYHHQYKEYMSWYENGNYKYYLKRGFNKEELSLGRSGLYYHKYYINEDGSYKSFHESSGWNDKNRTGRGKTLPRRIRKKMDKKYWLLF